MGKEILSSATGRGGAHPWWIAVLAALALACCCLMVIVAVLVFRSGWLQRKTIPELPSLTLAETQRAPLQRLTPAVTPVTLEPDRTGGPFGGSATQQPVRPDVTSVPT